MAGAGTGRKSAPRLRVWKIKRRFRGGNKALQAKTRALGLIGAGVGRSSADNRSEQEVVS